jgi:hypothetical protein
MADTGGKRDAHLLEWSLGTVLRQLDASIGDWSLGCAVGMYVHWGSPFGIDGIHNFDGRGMQEQTAFVARLFEITA